MKRFAVLLALATALVLGVTAPAAADVDDFSFASFDATYDLSTDDDGRSVLKVVETLVAVFPAEDQNRGIVRELVDTYDGHPTGLNVRSVTDQNGEPRDYESDSDDGFLELTIAGDDYVHGEQTYVITYEQHNVTRFFENTGADEFYWDTNGTGWRQTFGRVTATVRLTDELQSRLTGKADAAYGLEGQSLAAEATPTRDGYTFAVDDLGPGENLTFAIGFQPDTFVPRDDSFAAGPWPLLSLLSALGAAATAVFAFVLRRTRLRDAPGRGIIVPEYLPPKDASVLLSSVILGATAQATTAEILALAVAGNLRVVEVPGRWKASYRLEFITADGADSDGIDFLHALFGLQLTPGEGRDLKKPDQNAVSRIAKVMRQVTKRATATGFRRAIPAGPISLVVLIAVLFAVGATLFAAISFIQAFAGAIPAIFLVTGILALGATVVAVARVPLDAKGVALRDHLRGLRDYIRLAEADRLRFLQSPEGAEREPVASNDPRQVVDINERLLPYAVLFGAEKSWLKELGRYYEQLGSQPTWYYGSGPFNAALFANGVGAVATSVSSSYSSSSGGSGGGVSSGGGGGGGGGGGA